MTDNNPESQNELLTRLAFASLNEQRRARRWSLFFKGLLAAYLFLILFMIYLPGDAGNGKSSFSRHTAIIDVHGVISSEAEASADNIISGLRAAFKESNVAGIILRINSPGGSPVQAGYINDEIYRLRSKYPDKKLYAVITDICASGGYYIASAADEIYADKASIVGSIGVLMNGFGFVGALKKLGIERRLYTAGKNKGFLDPFSKAKPEDIKHIKGLLASIHQQFIDIVKEGRGDRIKDDKKLFSGLVWNGEEAVKLGLVDALGSSSYVAREIIKAEKIVNYTPRPNFIDRFTERLGVTFGKVMAEQLQPQPLLR